MYDVFGVQIVESERGLICDIDHLKARNFPLVHMQQSVQGGAFAPLSDQGQFGAAAVRAVSARTAAARPHERQEGEHVRVSKVLQYVRFAMELVQLRARRVRHVQDLHRHVPMPIAIDRIVQQYKYFLYVQVFF